MKIKSLIIIFFISVGSIYSQVEHVAVSHPVYNFLIKCEAQGLLPHFSSSLMPVSRNQIQNLLFELDSKHSQLSDFDKKLLYKYLVEFEVKNRDNAVVFYSSSDTIQVLSYEFIGNKEKFIYHYADSSKCVNVSPLGSSENIFSGKNKAILGNLGFRFYGSVGSHFGYYLQATNGSLFSGNRKLAVDFINELKQNIKFAHLNSDFDISESHIALQYDWFYASYGRETRLMGSGIINRLFISDNAPAQDALTLGAKFSNFEYNYSHSSLVASDQANFYAGFNSVIPPKYFVSHRFALKPEWGEIAFWEGIIYSRPLELAYITPISFFKSLEHALHDRDNSLMGADITIRPFPRIQIKGSYLLDDIIFSEIGKKFWSNKSAWNIGISYISPYNLDAGLEYSRVEPYTFTHFDSVNSYTNDQMLLGSNLLPNSDKLSLILNFWWGQRYPVTLKIEYLRHGDNVYNSSDSLTKNVGGDPLQTRRSFDPLRVEFLDGDLHKSLNYELSTGIELQRGFNLKLKYLVIPNEKKYLHAVILKLAFEDF